MMRRNTILYLQTTSMLLQHVIMPTAEEPMVLTQRIVHVCTTELSNKEWECMLKFRAPLLCH